MLKKVKLHLFLFLINRVRFWNGRLGIYSRSCLYQKLCKSWGKNVIIGPAVYMTGFDFIEIGNNVSIHQFSVISGEGGIKIGDNVSIAHNCSVLTTSHISNNPKCPTKDSGVLKGPVRIGENVWIGCGVRVLYNVNIGSGVVIGANTVVNKNLKNDFVYAGIPVKEIKPRL